MSQIMPFPRYLNTPQRLLFWTLDQLIPFGFFMCAGIITDRPLICITRHRRQPLAHEVSRQPPRSLHVPRPLLGRDDQLQGPLRNQPVH